MQARPPVTFLELCQIVSADGQQKLFDKFPVLLSRSNEFRYRRDLYRNDDIDEELFGPVYGAVMGDDLGRWIIHDDFKDISNATKGSWHTKDICRRIEQKFKGLHDESPNIWYFWRTGRQANTI